MDRVVLLERGSHVNALGEWTSVECGERHVVLLDGPIGSSVKIQLGLDGGATPAYRDWLYLRAYKGSSWFTMLDGPVRYRVVRESGNCSVVALTGTASTGGGVQALQVLKERQVL